MGKIIVSFKSKEKDLYDLVKSQGDQSNFVKDAIKFYIQNKNEKSPVAKTEVHSEEIQDIFESL